MIINPKYIELTNLVSFDLETTGLRAWENKIDLIAIKTEDNSFVLEADKYSKDFLIDLFTRIAQCEKVINQNIKFDLNFIYYHYGVLLKNVHCTLVTAQICENGFQKSRDFDLASILYRYLGVKHADDELIILGKDKKTGKNKTVTRKHLMQKSFIDPKLRDIYKTTPMVREKQIKYAAEDVEHMIRLYHTQMEKVSSLKLENVYRLEHTLIPVIVKMEVGGCLIDAAPWRKLIKESWIPEQSQLLTLLNRELEILLDGKEFKYKTMDQVTKSTQLDLFGNATTVDVKYDTIINYGSSEQILELIAFLGLEAPRDSEGKPSLEENILNVYLTEYNDTPLTKFIELLLKYRQITKLISTYGEKFLSKLDSNSYIHTMYTQTQTETGRASSKSPNLQNIPSPPKGDITKDIRRFFIASEGNLLVTCDMNSAEVAIAADYSKDPLLMASILEGADMHSELASVTYSIIFGKDVKISKSDSPQEFGGKTYIPDELRNVHKSVTFAKFYKGGAARVYDVLSKYINAHHKASARKKIAKQISDAFDERVPVLSKYLSDLIDRAKHDGYLRGSKLGRIRFFSRDVYGEASNYPIQNTNGEALKIALINIDRYFEQTGYGRLVMQIHDEVVCEVKEQYAQQVKQKVEQIMADSLSWFLETVKGGASAKVAKHWQK